MSARYNLAFLTICFTFLARFNGKFVSPREPSSSELMEAAAYARRLVNQSTWGVLSNNNYDTGTPFGNVVSCADGGVGTPYFYLTFLDQATANFSRVDQRASLSISEFALGTCGELDPQDPPCGKVTLSGRLMPVMNSTEEKMGRRALFFNHPRFAYVPLHGKFTVFKLKINYIYVVNNYAPPKRPSVEAYYRAKLSA